MTFAHREYTVSKGSVQDLYDMLMMMRPAFGLMDKRLISRYLMPLGCQMDKYGNAWMKIGDAPVMWSCHTDTVHRNDGYQSITKCKDTHVVKVHSMGGHDANCLGADDTAGVWLMREMILAKRPGLYVFHRAEECGGKGSRWIASDNKDFVKGIECCIALDRKGTDSVITYQSGGRCCSDDFGKSLASKLQLDYKLDEYGSFTDSASYTDLIGECTNLSVGYKGQHGRGEEQDVVHLLRLREALLDIDTRDITLKRKPGEKESRRYNSTYYRGGRSNYDDGYLGYRSEDWNEPDRHDLIALVDYPSSTTYGFYNGIQWAKCTKEEWDAEQLRRTRNRQRKEVGLPVIKSNQPALTEFEHDKAIRDAKQAIADKAKGGTKSNSTGKCYRMRNGRPVLDTVLDLVVDYPDEIAAMCEDWGFDTQFLREQILQYGELIREKESKGANVIRIGPH